VSRIATVFRRCGEGRTCGAERMALRTAEALAAAGHDVVLVETEKDWPARPPDLVHAYDLATPEPVAMARAYAARWGLPFLLTPASDPQVWPDPAAGARLCRAADAVFALTGREAEQLTVLGVPSDRIRLIPQAADLAGRAEPEAFKRRFGVGEHMVLFLGRRLPSKGFPLLRSAADRVWQRFPDTTFVLAGPAGDATPWEHPRVLDLGLAAEQTKHDALAACSVLCLPTRADVFPLVFVEAWACGRPVVSGSFPGVEGVVRDGIDGLVVNAATGPVADALIRLLADPRLATGLGAAGHDRVAHTMTWSHVAAAVAAGWTVPAASSAAAPPAAAVRERSRP
jgi:glycosyltransferase involved in cell wall biosynthesis